VEKGIDPVFQLTCRDRNRLALQSDVLSAWCLGIKNILCLTGDHPFLGDHAEAKPVYDLDSVQLIKAVSGLNDGRDLGGHELDGKTDFFIGAVVTPSSDPLEPQIIKMKKKIEAGAMFFQTQAVYDPEEFEEFLSTAKGFNVPVIAGLVLLKSAGMAKYMNQNVAGVNVPEQLIEEMANTGKEDRKKKSAEIAVNIIDRIKPLCQGVHIMALGWEDLIPEIINQAGL
jgi:5,10-methylenetetrahydrofolate reductase